MNLVPRHVLLNMFIYSYMGIMWLKKNPKIVTSLLQNLQYHSRLAPKGDQCHPEITPGVLEQDRIKLAQRFNKWARLQGCISVVKMVHGLQKLCLCSHISLSINCSIKKPFFLCLLVWSLSSIYVTAGFEHEAQNKTPQRPKMRSRFCFL